jgi:hypothetical protein
MNRRTQLYPPHIAASALQCRLANGIIQSRYACVLILFLVTFGLLAHGHAARTASNKSLRPAFGNLKIWVPAGMIGDDYWIYVNGRLRSAPPHGPTDPRSRYFMTVSNSSVGSEPETRYGWDIFTRDGLILSMRHEDYDHRLSTYINSASGDTLRVFQTIELPLPSDKYTVELVILSMAPSYGRLPSARFFPFVISRKYVADIRSGQTTQLYPGVPDDWSDPLGAFPVRALPRFCTGSPTPDADQMRLLVKDYMNDPMVKILRRASASVLSRPKGVVVLDLPLAQGGSREFDGTQIKHIADTISANHVLPKHHNVAECQRRFPQFYESYAEYDKMIEVIESEMESFRKFGAELERGQ